MKRSRSTRPGELGVEACVEGLLDNGKAEPRMRQYQGTRYEASTTEVGGKEWQAGKLVGTSACNSVADYLSIGHLWLYHKS